jgi:SAM-dependent methyltransferase
MLRKLKLYFNYWIFIGVNWNFVLATFTVYHEIKGERNYRINTIEIDRLKSISVKGENIFHSSIYQPCNYFILNKGFEFIRKIGKTQKIIDFGCGKGRVLVVAAHFGFREITGIDFALSLCKSAELNVQQTKSEFPDTIFRIIHEDVVHYHLEEDQNVLFFFNPFDEVIMIKVVRNIMDSFKKARREIYIIYANPVHKEIFLSAGFTEIYYLQKLKYLELSILKISHEEPEIT